MTSPTNGKQPGTHGDHESSNRMFAGVVEQLAGQIASGALPLGSRLPSERLLAAEMKASRSTVRRALKLLADRRVIEIVAGAGSQSGAFVHSDLVPRDLLGRAEEISWEGISEVLIARRLFEPQVAQVAGFVANAHDLHELERIIELQRVHAEDDERLRELDASFHLAIARATHNATVVAMLHTLLQRLQPVRRRVTPVIAQQLLELHIETFEAIASRDPQTIADAMDRHLSHNERIWERTTGRKLRQVLPDALQSSGDDRILASESTGPLASAARSD